jgi:hypothetical protein
MRFRVASELTGFITARKPRSHVSQQQCIPVVQSMRTLPTSASPYDAVARVHARVPVEHCPRATPLPPPPSPLTPSICRFHPCSAFLISYRTTHATTYDTRHADKLALDFARGLIRNVALLSPFISPAHVH